MAVRVFVEPSECLQRPSDEYRGSESVCKVHERPDTSRESAVEAVR